MNRVIKFRYGYTDGNNWIFEIFTLDEIENGEPYEFISDAPLLKKYVLKTRDQFIGRNDENGVDIYVGDIILTQAYTDKPYAKKVKSKRFKAVVYWDDKNARYDIKSKDRGIYRYGQYGSFFDIEKISTVHENPELLEDK
jgi:hypothetical protein